MTAPPLRLVLVEDSPTMSAFLRTLLEEAGFVVAGTATNVSEAEAVVRKVVPDLVLSDIRLPGGTGIDLTARLLSERAVPIVLITALDAKDPRLVFDAMRAGALEVLPKPPGRNDPAMAAYKRTLEKTLKLLASTPVIKRRTFGAASPVPPLPLPRTASAPRPALPTGPPRDVGVPPLPPPALSLVVPADPILAIGASTGGPALIVELLQALRGRKFAFGTLAQHIVPEFVESFRGWLCDSTGIPVRTATEGLFPEHGTFYVAPAYAHLAVGPDRRLRVLPESVTKKPHVPSVDVLFSSLSVVSPRQTLAILLTGMGSDGAAGLRELCQAGATTLVQSPETAAVDSMPKSAIGSGAARGVGSPAELAQVLAALAAREI